MTYLNNSAERISESVDRMLEIEKTIAMVKTNFSTYFILSFNILEIGKRRPEKKFLLQKYDY